MNNKTPSFNEAKDYESNKIRRTINKNKNFIHTEILYLMNSYLKLSIV